MAMARPLTTNNSDRLGPVARPGAEDRSSSISQAQGIGNSARAWTDSGHIWGSSPGLGSSTRDDSRGQDAPSFLASRDSVNGTATMNSFGHNLNTDIWNNSGWNTKGTNSQDRSVGVSPDRRSSGVGLLEGSLPMDNARVNGNRVTNGVHGATSFSGQRNSDASFNGMLGHFPRQSNGSSQQQGSLDSWGDGGSVHSPTDDRRSISNSEHWMQNSNAPSRNSSLPPSRGNESITWPVNESHLNRFGNTRGHTPSASSISGRYVQERQSSIPQDILTQQLGRINLDESDQLVPFQQQSLNPQSPTQALGQYIGSNYVQNLQESQSGSRSAHGLGSYTPESASTFNIAFPRQPFERGAFTPNPNDFRQSPNFSTNGASSAIDSSYSIPSQRARPDASANAALLQRRLRVIQQEQSNGLISHVPFQPSQFNPYRQPFNPNGFTSPYGLPTGLPLNAINIPPHLNNYGQGTLYPMLEAPRGPRENDGMTLQSELLVEFKNSNNKGIKQWQLKEIQGHVVEFCGDQLGSRFIQNKLETANSDDKQLIFNEILPDIIQLMQDVFGNYVIQKFFDHGDQTQKGQIAAAMKGHLMDLSTQMYACRVVQKAIDHILTHQQAALIQEIEPHVIKCVKDMNGNHVIQKAIERIPAEHIQFVVDAFTGKVGELATHSYGCRVIQRVLENCTEPVKRTILTELHSYGPSLITDQYGNYVTQHMIVHGFVEDRERVIEQVMTNFVMYSKHKFASNVVEKCIMNGSNKMRHEMLMVVLEPNNEQRSGLFQLITDGFGNYVVQKMLEMLTGDDFRILVNHLEPEMQKAKRTTASKHLAAVEKKMHRSSRSNSIQSPTYPTHGATTAGSSPSHAPLPRINLPSPTTDAPTVRSPIVPSAPFRAPVSPNHGHIGSRQPMAT